MALSIVNSSVQTGTASTGSTVAIGTGLTDANSGDIIIAQIGAEWVTSVGAAGTVLGVSGGGLTWQKRTGTSIHYVTTNNFDCWQRSEIWWAYSSGPLTTQVITATFSLPSSTNFDDACIICFAVTGFTGGAYPTAPWDSNVSLPVIANFAGDSVPTSTVPTLSTLSTTNAATMVLGAVFTSNNEQGLGGLGSGYSLVGSVTNGGAVNTESMDCEQQVFAAAQTNLTVNWTGARPCWTLIADALAQTGGSTDILQAQIWL